MGVLGDWDLELGGGAIESFDFVVADQHGALRVALQRNRRSARAAAGDREISGHRVADD